MRQSTLNEENKMRKGNVSVLWGSSKMIIVDHIPQVKIDRAVLLVNDCIAGKRGFCYKLVRRYPLHSGSELRNNMVVLKRERSNAATLVKRGDRITEKLATMRKVERTHYLYDERAYRTLRSNFDRLKRALELLHSEDYIEAYLLSGSGKLSVRWFSVIEQPEIQEIQQGWTFDERPVHSSVYPESNKDIGIPTKLKEEIISQGLVVKRKEEQVTKGSGELDPAVLRQRDKDNAYNRVQQKALYIQSGEQRKVDSYA